MKDYKKLDKSENYDHETVEELAEAMTELKQLNKRMEFLQELINENKELHQFIWGTAEGELLPHHKIEDDHLKNILLHQVRFGRPISKALRNEARRRSIEIPDNTPLALTGEVIEVENEDFSW
jgi:hypothetical protein